MDNLNNKDLEQVSGGASWEKPTWDEPIPGFEPEQIYESCIKKIAK